MVSRRKRVTAPDLRFDDEKLNRLMEYTKFLERELHKVQKVLDAGIAGQVLTKQSAATYDAGWADPTGGGGGTSADGNNLGTGEGEVFKVTMAGVLQFRTLKEGTNITITQDGEEVTIAATSSISVAWADITGKPSTFPPSSHSHPATAITYNNGTSGLLATNVQAAIDELAASGGGGGYTDEQAQDAVGSILVDTTTINFTYDDATPRIYADVILSAITIDWSQITSGVPAMLTDLATIGDPNADRILFWDDSAGAGGSLEWLTVGTGLSITGTTISATGASPLTTKGDLFTYSTADSRLAVGSDGDFVMADSSQATGLKYNGGMRLIGSVTASGSPSNMSLSGIPAISGKNLLIVIAGRCSSGLVQDVKVRFNGDSGANYDYQDIHAYQSGTNFTQTVGATEAVVGNCPGSTATANRSCAIDLVIPRYSGTVFDKQGISKFGNTLGTGGFNVGAGVFGFDWRPATPVAISSLEVFPSAGNWVDGSSLNVYVF